MTTRITYDYANVTNRDFAMPVTETIEDASDDNSWLLCPSCECGITEVDVALGECTNCGFSFTDNKPTKEN